MPSFLLAKFQQPACALLECISIRILGPELHLGPSRPYPHQSVEVIPLILRGGFSWPQPRRPCRGPISRHNDIISSAMSHLPGFHSSSACTGFFAVARIFSATNGGTTS